MYGAPKKSRDDPGGAHKRNFNRNPGKRFGSIGCRTPIDSASLYMPSVGERNEANIEPESLTNGLSSDCQQREAKGQAEHVN